MTNLKFTDDMKRAIRATAIQAVQNTMTPSTWTGTHDNIVDRIIEDVEKNGVPADMLPTYSKEIRKSYSPVHHHCSRCGLPVPREEK